MNIRLHKFIADNSKISRRSAEKLIEDGLVFVNGKKVESQGVKVDPLSDIVEVKGEKLIYSDQKKYIIIYKPEGYLCSKSDPHERKTVMDLLPEYYQDVYPVGRLDKDTSGLLLMTNDGDFAYEYTHPKFQHEKEYVVEIENDISEKGIRKLEKGIEIDGYKTQPSTIHIILETEQKTFLSIILYEGRKRQIRKMMQYMNKNIISLKRIRVDHFSLNELREGEWKKVRVDLPKNTSSTRPTSKDPLLI